MPKSTLNELKGHTPIHFNLIIMLSLGSIEIDCFISETV